MEYFIYMTNECNLHCEYCSVLLDCQKNNLPIKPVYTPESLSEFISTVQEQEKDNEINIYFFGGEPSLEYVDIERLMCYLDSKFPDAQVNYILHTNGLLLDRIPNSILNRLKLIMFSINYEKIPKHGLKPSYFHTIIQNALITKQKRNLPMIGRLTITEKTSLYADLLLTSNYFDLMYWQIENCSGFDSFNSFYDSYTFEVEETYRYWKEYLKKGILLKYVPFMAVLKFMFYHDRNDNFFSCGYSRGMIYIQTDGCCYACSDSVETKQHHIGNIHSGIKLPKYVLRDFRCNNCDYRRICMGRCGRMHIEFSNHHISEYCQLNQYMFNLFLKDKDELCSILSQYPSIEKELNSELLEYTEFTP